MRGPSGHVTVGTPGWAQADVRKLLRVVRLRCVRSGADELKELLDCLEHTRSRVRAFVFVCV